MSFSSLNHNLPYFLRVTGTIKGRIYGAKKYDDGFLIEIKPAVIGTEMKDHMVVETDLGKRYLLDGESNLDVTKIIDKGMDKIFARVDFFCCHELFL